MEAILDTSEWDTFLAELSGRYKKAAEYLKLAVETKGRADVLDHFRKAEGPSGPWPKRKNNADPTRALLVLTGRLRGSILPSGSEGGVRILGKDAVMLFSAVEYSRAHDQGIPGRLPKREFMWLSKEGQDSVGKVFLGALMEGL